MSPHAPDTAGGAGPFFWLELARDLIGRKKPAVLAMITRAEGSTPRGPGAAMVVSEEGVSGTLGGGTVEFEAGRRAKELLQQPQAVRRVDSFRLGPDLGQCCGGALDILFEPLDGEAERWLAGASDVLRNRAAGALVFPLTGDAAVRLADDPHSADQAFMLALHDPRRALTIYGAGHVGQAIAAIGASLPLTVEVVDQRSDMLTAVPAAANVAICQTDDVEGHVAALPAGTAVLVMTHSHALDAVVCAAALARGDLAFIGLIGSDSKAARFRRILREEGLSEDELARLVSPIGLAAIPGKEPGVIALAALGQILALN